jgi:hypothetical protein
MATCPSGAWSGRVWLDVSNSQYWYTPWRDVGYTSNKRFYQDFVDACTALPSGMSCGIYSSAQQWGYTFNDKTYSYAPANGFPLWYISLDGVADVNTGFTAFGGFTTPYAKEYLTEPTDFCGYSSSKVYASVTK